MAHSRLLLGSFDLFNIGHLTQLNAVSDRDAQLTAAVISDAGVAAICGSNPFLLRLMNAPPLSRSFAWSRTRSSPDLRTTGLSQNMTHCMWMLASGIY